MSASREKQNRQDGASGQGPSPRAQKRMEEERSARRSMILYTVVGILCVVFAVFLIIWKSGIVQRSLTAVTVNGVSYTAVDAQYYYDYAYSNILTYYANFGMSPFDTSVSLKEQVYDTETGQTWHDYLMEQALDYMVFDTAMTARASEEGYTLSEDAQSSLESSRTDLETVWVGSYNSRDAYIRANYGPYMTYDHLMELLEMRTLASDYASSYYDGLTYDDADYDAYYQENADDLDTYTLTILTTQARVDTVDEEGNAIEMTEEEQAAALEEAKAQAQAVAQDVEARLQAGEDPQTLSDEYGEELYSTVISSTRVGSSVNSAYSEWVFDSARQNGDVTLVEYDSGSMYYYYVVRFEGRALDDSPSASVRHILVSPETDEGADEPTQEQMDAALAEAESLLAEWQAGEATEDSFAALAQSSSDDTGSATSGGLISNITSTSSYVDSFKEWALDASRQPGDTGIVESEYGYHIMYYVSSGDPTWKQTAASALREEDYTAWEEEATSGYEAVTEFGMNFVA